MDFIVQRARRLISWMMVGAFFFLLLGYLAKAIPAVMIGVAILTIAINAFGLFLFIFYPDLREEVGLGLAVELFAMVILCL